MSQQLEAPILVQFKHGTSRQQEIDDMAFIVQQLSGVIQKCQHVQRIIIPSITNDQSPRGVQPDSEDQGTGQ